MKNSIPLTVITLLLAASRLSAATHYVSLGSTNPTPPYATWARAATNIQDAVDAATFGDTVVVTNGVYPGGVSVAKPLKLLSVNGPQLTVVQGGAPCVSLTNGASVTGFTLTAGLGGGVNCVGEDWWAPSMDAFLTNCVITGNSSGGSGGGAYGCTLYNCTLTGNSSTRGGGAADCRLYKCTLSGNSVTSGPGQPGSGGGADGCTLYNCTLAGNSCTGYVNTDSGHYFNGYGGGAYFCTLYNCTLMGNSCTDYGGGADWSSLYNCIVYSNTATNGANYDASSTLNYCCTTPLPTNGVGNIALDPQLASASHLSASSPCRGAGSSAYATCTDIDGEPWGNPPSMGCDEYHAKAVTGPLSVGIAANYTNVVVSWPVSLTALIAGRTTYSVWDFGDGVTVTNRVYASHAWAAPGDYAVVLWGYNESLPGGASATVTIHVVTQPVYYVAATSTNAQPPYTSWAAAATNLQQAVASAAPTGVIVVTNGVYPGGVSVDRPLTLSSVNGPQFTVINGGGTNRCAFLSEGVSLTGFTLTNGQSWENGGGVGCASGGAFLTNCVMVGNLAHGYQGGGASGCTLYNCTLTGNSAYYDGGGAYDCTLYNCTLSNNSASRTGGGASGCWLYNCRLTANLLNFPYPAGQAGGGAYNCTLNNCVLYGNSVWGFNYPYMLPNWGYGGGAAGSILYNCTVVGNSGAGPPSPSSLQYTKGGGAYYCTLYNSIVYSNSAGSDPDCSGCGGNEIWTSDALFVDYAHGNLRLLSNSPCINAGNNAYVTTTTDLDGRPRIVGGTVDIGAYEDQGPFSQWLQQYGLPTDGSADYTDPDHDGLNNWQEWVCGTNPKDPQSALRLLSPSITSTNVTVTWQSVAGVNYFLERGTSLSSPLAFLATNILGQPGVTSYADTNPAGAGPFFYRVGVKSP